jgi:Domain of unknown function (DUF4214)/Subtilase family
MRRSWNRTKDPRSSCRLVRPRLEEFETRALLSVFAAHRPPPGSNGYTPAQILQAYGFDQLGLAQPGLGQTIALVEAYQLPNLQADLATFNERYGLPAANLTVVNDGATGPDLSGGWDQEAALDVEWAHAIAPYADLVVVQAADDAVDDAGVPLALLHAASVAASQPNVTVVSMSWGVNEFSAETLYDGTFAVPGVTFVAAAGDEGAPPIWPAISPAVVAVGGTSLQADSAGAYVGETGWGHGSRSAFRGGSGGGVSLYEAAPAYQQGGYASSVTDGGGMRLSPDVAYDGDPNTGVSVYERMGGWAIVGGTSAGTPQWAALIALADQLRAAASPALPPLSSTETLTALYQSQGDFHDVTTGSNGYDAGAGFDLVTGLGTPKAEQLVPDLARARTNASFVTQDYQTLLGRDPDAAGLAFWTGLLDRGASRFDIARGIEGSAEYQGVVVGQAYQQVLRRAVDPSGLANWTRFLAQGGTPEELRAALLGSREFFETFGPGSNDAFLDALYQTALNRPADDAGKANWEQVLAGGVSRQDVALAILRSREASALVVQDLYGRLLGRAADAGGLASFTDLLQQGVGDDLVIAALTASAEYASRGS